MSSASWKNQGSLSQLAPSALSSALGGLNTVLGSATGIIRTIESIVKVAENFIVSPADVLVTFLSSYSSALFQVVADTLSLGGGFIFIHPYNRINFRTQNILPVPTTTKSEDTIIYPLNLPVMTPQEALNEFYASFNNVNDPFRPQWTANTEVSGFGLLVVAPDPTSLVQVMNAFAQILNLKEIADVQTKYSIAVQSWYDTTINMIGSDFSHFLDFDITGLNIQTVTTTLPDGSSSTSVTQVFDNTLPSLHWYGLSLANFTFLKNLQKLATDLVNSLLSLVQSTTNFVKEIGDALIRRLQSVLNLVTTVIQVAEGFLIALNSTGVYYFSVPSGVGGVPYIQQAIQSSLTNPQNADAQQVKALLNTSRFSALFFAGAGYGVNLSAWDALFKNAFDATNFAFQNAFGAQFSVMPSFDNAVFTFGQTITITVVSQDSTPAAQLYYTYSVTDYRGQIVSSFTNQGTSNDARVNLDSFNIVLAPPTGNKSPVGTLTYTLDVQVFNLAEDNKKVSYTFYGTDSVSAINTTVDGQTPLSITAGQCGGTLRVVNSNAPAGGYATETVVVAPNSTAQAGTTIGPSSTNMTLAYQSACDDSTSFTLPISNNTGFRIANLSAPPLPPSFRFLTYPAKLCLNFTGALKYEVAGSDEWTTVALPACISLAENTCYSYYLYTPATGWGPLMGFCTVQQAQEGTQVC